MTETQYLFSLIVVAASVTIFLRAFPFLLFGSGVKKTPRVISYIGRVLSPAAIAMLAVYCYGVYFQQRIPAEHCFGLAELAAGALVVALQLWKRNALFSISSGTLFYMFCVQYWIV